MAQGGPQVVADILGMTPQELRTEMQAGKTLAQVAEAKGVSRDALKAKLLESHKTRIDAAVAAGQMTAEQAQQMTERANANIDQMLDRTPGQRPGPRGPRTGG
jgi:lambda repressor-like predicted transcriptional regulator